MLGISAGIEPQQGLEKKLVITKGNLLLWTNMNNVNSNFPKTITKTNYRLKYIQTNIQCSFTCGFRICEVLQNIHGKLILTGPYKISYLLKKLGYTLFSSEALYKFFVRPSVCLSVCPSGLGRNVIFSAPN